MLEIPSKRAIEKRLRQIEVRLELGTEESLTQILEKDVPWLLGCMKAHRGLLVKWLQRAIGPAHDCRYFAIEGIPKPEMDAMRKLFRGEKKPDAKKKRGKK